MELPNNMECDCQKHKEGFPPKVLIPQPMERQIAFRLVKIPAALGDDTQVKPENGLYHNVILNYEANNHTYIYSSDGIPVRIDGRQD